MLVALGLFCAACAIVAVPALAVSEFATEGEGAGQLSHNPFGVAINQASGDVYVADQENNRVDQFSAEGTFLRTWGFGVSNGASETFQICNAPGPCFAGIGGVGGTAGGQLALPNGIAIDNSAGLIQGDVYVEDPSHRRIARYGPAGEFILAFGGEVNKTTKGNVCLAGEECQAGTPGPGPSQFETLESNAIAVGPTGTVYVGDVERVQKFSAAGAPEGEIKLPAGAGVVEGLVVDSTGEIYVLSSGLEGIRKYNGAGEEQGEARDPEAHGVVAITLAAGDELLVSDPAKRHVFGYDSTGTQLLSIPQEEDANGGIALHNSTEALYAIHREPARILVQRLPPAGPVILEGSEAASEVLPTTAELSAKVNPEGPSATTCLFEYGTSEAYDAEVAATPLTGGEFEDQPITAPLSGLQPRTVYHFRAVCENALKQKTLGPDETFETLPPVSIDSESTTKVTASSATLIAELNPHGLPTEYHFEYGLSSTYEQSAPVPDAEAGEGTKDESFSVTVQELHPESLYHYRVVAHNALGLVQGPDETFRTQGAPQATLPDGRADEMVSPPQKHGVSLEGLSEEGGVIEAGKEGDGLAYIATGPIDEAPEGNRSNAYSQLLAKREAAGVWSTKDIATPHQAPAGVILGRRSEYQLFSSDLERGAVEPAGATPLSPSATSATPYRHEADGSYTPFVYPGNVQAGAKWAEEGSNGVRVNGIRLVTGTPDLSRVLLHSRASLVEGFEFGGQEAIYEWDEGKLTPASVLPGGVSASEEGDASVGNANFQVRNAISSDGNRVFFETSTHSRLYARDMRREETIRLDTAEAGLNPPEGGAKFQLASSDGSKVFFTDGNKLTKDATATPVKPDLYECAITIEAEKLACALHDLSVDQHPGESAAVQGDVIGASEDGRYVYYVAEGALAEGAVSGACPKAGEGQCVNLYVYDTQAQSKALVAVLSGEDFPDWRGDGGTNLSEVTSRVSPDGRYAAFMSKRSLTGYDNRDARSEARDEEVFLYHAPDDLSTEAGTLGCASCDPTGQRPAGVLDEESFPGLLIDRPRRWGGQWLAGSIPGWTRVSGVNALHQSRYLANSGRLFFNSLGALVPADQNATQDVYEYEPNSVGSCSEESGCVSLISSGTSSEESAFLDASESGDDVFFLTAAQLSSSDKDNAFDVYDAHVCSDAPGCPAPLSGEPPPCASTDACRAAPSPQPDIFGAPASSSFNGSGNLAPAGAAAVVKAKSKPTRAQELAKAIRICKKQRSAKGRARCIKRARTRFGPKHAGKQSSSAGARRSSRAASAKRSSKLAGRSAGRAKSPGRSNTRSKARGGSS